jgi:hypothetical protein
VHGTQARGDQTGPVDEGLAAVVAQRLVDHDPADARRVAVAAGTPVDPLEQSRAEDAAENVVR